MDRGNQSLLIEFIIVGFPVTKQTGIALFVTFLAIYLLMLASNGLIIAVVHTDSRLHSPMYYFLCNLAYLDIAFLSTNVTTCLNGFLYKPNIVPFSTCVAQMVIGLALGISQCILLAVMAWDRYVAICKPLSYHSIVSKATCIRLSVATILSGLLLSMVQVFPTVTVPFCGHNTIDHYICELAPALHLACVDIRLQQLVILIISVGVIIVPVLLITFSYLRIFYTILRMPASSRRKAFSTCSSHLTVVILFYGSIIVMYMLPKAVIPKEDQKIFTLIYGLVTPVLNPLIYTLRNKEIKGALKKLISVRVTWQGSKPLM
ncbi:olfactory receptor 2G3-like [Lissotriton helveticus]